MSDFLARVRRFSPWMAIGGALAVAAVLALSLPAAANSPLLTVMPSTSTSANPQCELKSEVDCKGNWKITVKVTTTTTVCFYTGEQGVEKIVTQTTTYTHTDLGLPAVGGQPLSLRVYLLGCGKGKELVKEIILKKPACPSASVSASASPSPSVSKSASASPSASRSTSVSPSTSVSASVSASVSTTPLSAPSTPPSDSLPVTGLSLVGMVFAGVVTLILGGWFYSLPYMPQWFRRRSATR